MSASDPQIPEEMLRSKAEQVRLTQKFHYLAKMQGGYVMFHVPLPFKIPLQDGFLYGWDPKIPRFLELIHYPGQGDWHQIEQFGEPIFPKEGGSDEKIKSMVGSSYTVVRIGSSISYDRVLSVREGNAESGHSDEWLDKLLEDGLQALNLVIRAYRMVANDVDISTVESTSKLPFALLFTLWDIRKSKDLAFGVGCLKRKDVELLSEHLYLVNIGGVRVPRETLGFEDTSKVVGIASQAIRGVPDPFFSSADLVRDACTKLKVGEANVAVIECVTAVEVFVSIFLRLDLENQGLDKSEIDKVLETGFKNKLKDHLGQKMGFTVRRGYLNNPIERWSEGAYALRNDIVHKGKIASIAEAREALVQTDEVFAFLQEKVKQDPSERYGHIRKYIEGTL